MSFHVSKLALAVTVSLSLSAVAQAEDDRFKPRIYGSLAVTPAQISPEAARISGLTQSRNVIVQPTTQYGTSHVIQASSTSSSGQYYTPVELEAQKNRHFQSAPIQQNYQVDLFEPTETRIITHTEPVTTSYQTYEAAAPTARHTHLVDSGDTLYGLARNYNTSVDKIMILNGLSQASINVGQVLAIPGQSSPVVSASSTRTVQSTPSQTSSRISSNIIRTVEPVPNSGVYAVLPNDTLYSISKRACVSVEGIQAQNALGGSTNISPGQRLQMPFGHCLN